MAPSCSPPFLRSEGESGGDEGRSRSNTVLPSPGCADCWGSVSSRRLRSGIN
ncbi:hypothetical protein STPH2_3030 [Streptomyces sp. KO7888]|nr:hypothetical protein [Streptomyces sp. KO7888]